MNAAHRKDDPEKLTVNRIIGADTRITIGTAILVGAVLLGGQAWVIKLQQDMNGKIDEINREAVTISDLEALQDAASFSFPLAKDIQTRRIIANARRGIPASND